LTAVDTTRSLSRWVVSRTGKRLEPDAHGKDHRKLQHKQAGTECLRAGAGSRRGFPDVDGRRRNQLVAYLKIKSKPSSGMATAVRYKTRNFCLKLDVLLMRRS
jgi:hypothetical protein